MSCSVFTVHKPELLTVPRQIFAMVFAPVGQCPAFHAQAVDPVRMPARTMRVTVDQGGVAVSAEKIVGGRRVEVWVRHGSFTFGGFALPAHGRNGRPAFAERSAEKIVAPGRRAHARTKRLIVNIAGAQRVPVREDKTPARQGQATRVGKQDDPGTRGKMLAEQEIAVSMQEGDAGSPLGAHAQTVGNLAGKTFLGIIECVVTWPRFEQVAQDEDSFGQTRVPGKIAKEQARDTRCVRREMQVRKKVKHARRKISRVRRVR